MANGRPSVLVIINRQPNANIIETVDRVTALLPSLRASIPSAITLDAGDGAHDHHPRVAARHRARADASRSCLVILVVFLFLRNARATLIPSVAVPVSLIGTFGVDVPRRLLGQQLHADGADHRHRLRRRRRDRRAGEHDRATSRQGMPPFAAALHGAREVGFTVLSMSLSLIAVFIPILLMGGIVGRLFREFAVTLSVAILVSLVVSLTTTPMMCARLLRPAARAQARAAFARGGARAFAAMPARLPREPRLGARHGVARDARAARHGLPQRLPLRDHSEGLLPAAGHGAPGRRHPGRPEHLVPGDAAEARRFHDIVARRPGGRERRRLHRRRAAQFRASCSSR